MSSTDPTVRKILAAARAVVERGEAPTMGRIAAEAAVSRQLLYLRFEGRSGLLLELSRAVDAEVRTPALQASVDDAPDGAAALQCLVAVQAAIKPAIEGVVLAMDRLRHDDADVAVAYAEREQARWERCRSVVARLAEERRLSPDLEVDGATDLVWSSTSQRAWRELVVDRGVTTAAWEASTTRLLVRALLR